MMRPRRLLHIAAASVVCVMVLWGTATAALYAAMRQPPETFGRIMSHVPSIAMVVLPFKPLWMRARSYTGWPDRLYVIETDGRVRHKSPPGPFGFSTANLEQHLKEMLQSASGQ